MVLRIKTLYLFFLCLQRTIIDRTLFQRGNLLPRYILTLRTCSYTMETDRQN